MKIERVEIWNLRAFERVEVPFDDYTCLVGANGAGKSTILCALNIFFRQTEHTGTNLQNLEKEDFFKADTSRPIRIRVTFGSLGEEASQEFAHYVRSGKLIVTTEAVFDEASGRALVRHYGERLAMRAFGPFFERYDDGAPAAELNELYDTLQQRFTDLPSARSKDAKVEALRAYEQERPGECEPIPSEDEFYGVSRGANRLERFVQWVYVPAVKDALDEQVEGKGGALAKLVARAVGARTEFLAELERLKEEARSKYQALLDQHQGALDDISTALNERLSQWAHLEASLKLEWQEDPDRSVRIDPPVAHIKIGEGAFEGKLARLGHGLQRSYIISLLQELAMYGRQNGPTLLLAIEEPELYQHPPQARHLAGVLAKLGSEGAQVMVSTHSPFFVSGRVFENVRVVRRPAKNAGSIVRWGSAAKVGERIANAEGKNYVEPSATIARLQQILQPQLAEMFFASKVVLVEGREDVAFIQTWLQLAGLWDEFRTGGCHLVATDGKDEILRPLIAAQETGIPAFVVFDADGDVAKDEWKLRHEQYNRRLLNALGSTEAAFPANIVWGKDFVVWPVSLRDSVKGSVDGQQWQECQTAANLEFGNPGGFGKNVMQIACFLEQLWAGGVRPQPLEELSRRLAEFARS
jgi:energy-coupling factor transporter ATP-binding protein EcfA2